MDAGRLIEILDLKPLPQEGGYYKETYRSNEGILKDALPGRYASDKAYATAIYYLLTPEVFSAMHRVKSDEVFHFYSGCPVEMLLLYPDGSHKIINLGNDIESGENPQVTVPRGVWQGCRLRGSGTYALMGTTVSPGFDFDDYENGSRESLIINYPDCADMIRALTRG